MIGLHIKLSIGVERRTKMNAKIAEVMSTKDLVCGRLIKQFDFDPAFSAPIHDE